ncbi:hypothetical protein So717_28500 [Roseobacter cerasinus]|uniref:Uncharacterized protein n=1 Tax=Roseobacter cerasinus TaxID=2602289 RepID=A0A640VTE8_9RHOB|nr:hypothetical protein So717_28500 [Roseobacter cerasinus]
MGNRLDHDMCDTAFKRQLFGVGKGQDHLTLTVLSGRILQQLRINVQVVEPDVEVDDRIGAAARF